MRAIAWVQAANPQMAGIVTDLPTDPVTARFQGMTKAELQAEVDRLAEEGRPVAVTGTGSGGTVLKQDLVNALAGANL